MNSEPVDNEVPIEFDDLFNEIQEALLVYNMLQDNIDSMNGIYLGKVITGINDIFYMFEIEDKSTCYKIIQILDRHRSEIVNKKQKSKQRPAKKS